MTLRQRALIGRTEHRIGRVNGRVRTGRWWDVEGFLHEILKEKRITQAIIRNWLAVLRTLWLIIGTPVPGCRWFSNGEFDGVLCIE